VDGDADFAAGADVVRFDVPLAGAAPARIEVDLFYQPLGARWLAERFRFDTPEVRAFRGMWAGADKAPVRVAGATAAP
jgi:hypothetical protein